MNDVDFLSVVLRWFHIVGAVVAVGGAVFIRFVLLPSAASLPEEPRKKFRAEVSRRYAKLYMASLGILFITGFANYFMYAMPRHQGQGAYHGVIGVKIMLAIGVAFIGSALVGRAAAFEGIRKRAPYWLAINILLALVIFALAGIARQIPYSTGP